MIWYMTFSSIACHRCRGQHVHGVPLKVLGSLDETKTNNKVLKTDRQYAWCQPSRLPAFSLCLTTSQIRPCWCTTACAQLPSHPCTFVPISRPIPDHLREHRSSLMGSWNPGPAPWPTLALKQLPGLHRLYAGLDKNSHSVFSLLTWPVGKCPCLGLELNSRGIWRQWSVWALDAKLCLSNQFWHDLSLASQKHQWGHLNFGICFSKISRWDQVFSKFS